MGRRIRIVLFDEPIKQCLFGTVAFVTANTVTRAGFPASWRLRHDRFLAWAVLLISLAGRAGAASNGRFSA